MKFNDGFLRIRVAANGHRIASFHHQRQADDFVAKRAVKFPNTRYSTHDAANIPALQPGYRPPAYANASYD